MDHPCLRAFQDHLIDGVQVRRSHRAVGILDEGSQFCGIGGQSNEEASEFIR